MYIIEVTLPRWHTRCYISEMNHTSEVTLYCSDTLEVTLVRWHIHYIGDTLLQWHTRGDISEVTQTWPHLFDTEPVSEVACVGQCSGQSHHSDRLLCVGRDEVGSRHNHLQYWTAVIACGQPQTRSPWWSKRRQFVCLFVFIKILKVINCIFYKIFSPNVF